MSTPKSAQTIKTPSADIPPSSNTCTISLIDTTTDLVVKTSALLEPEIQGHENLNLPTFAFYIFNPRINRRVLFDLGCRKDWWNLPPKVVESIEGKGVPGIRITSGIDEILSAGGVDIKTIDAVVWSHYHWDHIGNIQLFPSSTDVVVGAGFKRSFLPGYPINPSSPFYADDFTTRRIREIDFNGDGCLQIGPIRAFDFFGDKSFYILNTPGHTAGHISGLVRTTAETFIFLGGDISHFPGAYRPSTYVSMPQEIPSTTKLDARLPQPCPCSLFTACHPAGMLKGRSTPFYSPSTSPESWYEDAAEAKRSIEGLEAFDADENVFIAIAHDPGLREIGEKFPHFTMNDWKDKEWKSILHWHFVNELPINGIPGRPKLAETREKQ